MTSFGDLGLGYIQNDTEVRYSRSDNTAMFGSKDSTLTGSVANQRADDVRKAYGCIRTGCRKIFDVMISLCTFWLLKQIL